MQIDFSLPAHIDFGRKVRFELASLLPDGAVLVIAGRHCASQVEKEKVRLFGARNVRIFSEIPPEVPLSAVDAARKAAVEIQAASIVGIGGGSAIDAAKAVAALVLESAPTADFFYGKRQPAPRQVTVAALPTTAGTGAEVTANAVLHDEATNIKQSLRTPNLAADIALVDPELAENAPASVMAASGMDALTQAIESFTSCRADALTRQISSAAAKMLLANLEAATHHEKTAVDAVCRASLLTGIAFSRSGLGAVHGLAHPLGCVRQVPHGIACAVLLGAVLDANRQRAPEVYRSLSASLGFEGSDALFTEIAALRQRLGIGEKFDFALNDQERDFIIGHSRSGSMKCNIVSYTDEELGAILDAVTR